MATLLLDGLVRHHRGAERPALDGLTLELQSGEIVVIVGPSGCGKSTALRLVAGLDRPTGGRVVLDGQDVTETPPQDRDVAMVFQGYALYPHMKVRENIAFPLRMRGVSKAEQGQRVAEAAALLALTPLLDRYPAELSGGERQRVAMGRAVVRKPKAFLFDEPLSNLDAALRAELRTELATLVRRVETTSLYVTHDQVEAMTLGDRMAVLSKGKLEQVGAPREVYERPATTFVATFVGSPAMTLIELDVSSGHGKTKGLDFALPEGLKGQAQLTLGLRPEHLAIATKDGKKPTIMGEVRLIEPLGAETLVHVEASGIRLVLREHGFFEGALGDKLAISLDVERAHWFDTKTGLRVEAKP